MSYLNDAEIAELWAKVEALTEFAQGLADEGCVLVQLDFGGTCAESESDPTRCVYCRAAETLTSLEERGNQESGQ